MRSCNTICLLFLLALCLSWGGFNLGRSLFGPKFGLDFTQYYVASRMAFEGEAHDIYRRDHHYRAKAAVYGAVTDTGTSMTNAYPPFAALCLAPFALLPFRPALLFFSITSLLALGAGVWTFFADDKTPARRDLICAGLLITFSFFPVYYSLYMGQINALLFLCIALTLYFARRMRPWPAGFFLGLATLVKIFPGVLIFFFAARREYRIVVTTVVSIAVLAAVSLTVCDAGLYSTYVSEVLPRLAKGSAFFRNQSLGGLFTRLLSDNGYLNALANHPALAYGLGAFGGALVLVAALFAAARRGGSSPGGDLAFSLCLVATVLALPISWEHYGVLLLFAYLAILRLVVIANTVPRVPLLLTFVSFCVWTFLLPGGTDYAQLPRSILMQPLFLAKCLATALLFVACIWLLLRSDQARSMTCSRRAHPLASL